MVVLMRRLLTATLLTVALAGCGQSAGSDDHNDADVTFAQGMVPHHEQAVEMADMVDGAEASPEVVALAGKIEKAQQPEIDQMNGWLEEWGADDSGHAHGSDDEDHEQGHDGMMSEADMTALGTLSGAEFDEAWLTMMIEHHEGAVRSAQTEVADGKHPDAIALAKNIITSQQGEIDQMKGLLP